MQAGSVAHRGPLPPRGRKRAARPRLAKHASCSLWRVGATERSLTRGVWSVAVRRSLLLPRDDTNAYRLVNGEGDRMSGVGLLPPPALVACMPVPVCRVGA